MSQMKNSQHPIKAIVFDLDGVYFNKGKPEFLSSLARYGVEEASAKSVFLTSQQMGDYKLGKIDAMNSGRGQNRSGIQACLIMSL